MRSVPVGLSLVALAACTAATGPTGVLTGRWVHQDTGPGGGEVVLTLRHEDTVVTGTAVAPATWTNARDQVAALRGDTKRDSLWLHFQWGPADEAILHARLTDSNTILGYYIFSYYLSGSRMDSIAVSYSRMR